MNALPFSKPMIAGGLAFGCLVSTCTASAQRPAPSAGSAQIPKVVLVGDSIRLGYAPIVARFLSGKAAVASVDANGGDSGNVLRNLEEWVIREKPDIGELYPEVGHAYTPVMRAQMLAWFARHLKPVGK